MKPRILFLALQLGTMGGLETVCLDTIKALQVCGCFVDVWTRSDKTASSVRDVSYKTFAPANSMARYIYLRTWKWILPLVFYRMFRKYDLIVVGHIHLLGPAQMIARRLGVPYWVWTYGSDTWNDWPNGIKLGLQNASQVVSISNSTIASIKKRLPDRNIVLIPPAVDIERFRPFSNIRHDEDCFNLLTVARLSSEQQSKGHDLVIHSLPLVQKRVSKPVIYQIAGTGDDMPRLQQLAEDLGEANDVQFLGFVPDNELPELYNHCDVYVMPSKTEFKEGLGWIGEGFGISYTEAAACGKPVISSNQGGAPEAIQNGITGFAVEPTSVEAIADAICDLLLNPELARQMGVAGRLFVEGNFSKTSFFQKIARLLETSGFDASA